MSLFDYLNGFGAEPTSKPTPATFVNPFEDHPESVTPNSGIDPITISTEEPATGTTSVNTATAQNPGASKAEGTDNSTNNGAT